MKILNLLELHEWDGGDRSYYKRICVVPELREEAKKVRPHDSFVTRTIYIVEAVTDFTDIATEIKKAAALAKLSLAERKLLGLE